jgi:hypothetical protein
VIPVSKWLRFRPKVTYQTLSLEEAEATVRFLGERFLFSPSIRLLHIVIESEQGTGQMDHEGHEEDR